MIENAVVDQSISLNKDLVNDLYLYLILEADITEYYGKWLYHEDYSDDKRTAVRHIKLAIEILDALKAFKDKRGKDISEKYSVKEIAKLDQEIEKIEKLSLFVIECNHKDMEYINSKHKDTEYRKSLAYSDECDGAFWYLLYVCGERLPRVSNTFGKIHIISENLNLNTALNDLSKNLKGKFSVDAEKIRALIPSYRKYCIKESPCIVENNETDYMYKDLLTYLRNYLKPLDKKSCYIHIKDGSDLEEIDTMTTGLPIAHRFSCTNVLCASYLINAINKYHDKECEMARELITIAGALIFTEDVYIKLGFQNRKDEYHFHKYQPARGRAYDCIALVEKYREGYEDRLKATIEDFKVAHEKISHLYNTDKVNEIRSYIENEMYWTERVVYFKDNNICYREDEKPIRTMFPE